MSCWPEIHPSQVLAGLYSASAREYADLWAPVLQPTSERLIAAMPLAGASMVLDLGTGTGALLPALRAAAPKACVIGVDRATGMLAEARQAARPCRVDSLPGLDGAARASLDLAGTPRAQQPVWGHEPPACNPGSREA